MIDRAGRLLALAAVVIGVMAGCGGGSDVPSKQQFANKADGVCADVDTRVRELNKTRPRSIAELMRFIDQLKAATSDGIKRLQALERPKGEAGRTAQQFTDTLDSEYNNQVLPALNALQRAVAKRDKKALAAASKKLRSVKDTESRQLASQLGAAQCAKN